MEFAFEIYSYLDKTEDLDINRDLIGLEIERMLLS